MSLFTTVPILNDLVFVIFLRYIHSFLAQLTTAFKCEQRVDTWDSQTFIMERLILATQQQKQQKNVDFFSSFFYRFFFTIYHT